MNHTKPRAACVAVASCLAATLLSASGASAAVGTAAFDPVPSQLARNTPLTVTLRLPNPGPDAANNVALGVNARQFLDDETNPPVNVTGYTCADGTKLTTLPPGTPPGTVACHWDTVAGGGGKVAMTVTILPADGASVSLIGYQSVGGAGTEVDEAFTRVALRKANFNLQASAPAQLAVGETGQLKTTLNNVSGDSADGVHQVPRFSLFGFSTRNADVLAVSATAGTCKVEPEKTFDPTSGKQIVVPDMVNISCQGGKLAPGGSITATVTVKGKSPGVVRESPGFFVSGMVDSTPLTRWWEYPEFRVGIYKAPAPPAFVDPTPLDQAELVAPTGGLLKVTKNRVAKLTASCPVAAGCPQAVLFYKGGKGKKKIAGHANLRALANGKSTTVKLKLTKKQFKALKAAKKKGIQVKITGAELAITVTLVARK